MKEVIEALELEEQVDLEREIMEKVSILLHQEGI